MLRFQFSPREENKVTPLFRLAAEVLAAIEAGVFHPNPGWHNARSARSGASAGRGGRRLAPGGRSVGSAIVGHGRGRGRGWRRGHGVWNSHTLQARYNTMKLSWLWPS